MNSQNLQEKAKTARLARYLTNCYSMELIEKAEAIWTSGDSFLFSYNDHGVDRLVYFSQNYEVLNQMLAMTDHGKYYLEFMAKDPGEYTPANTDLVARLVRLANPDCRSILTDSAVLQYWDESVGEYAEPKDAAEINDLLWSTFKTEVSHLLNENELKEVIQKKQVLIHRGESIDAVLQLDVLPKKFYVNQVINKGEKKTIHAMMLNQIKKYVDQGGKYIYAWVDEKNIASLKFHAKYGMKHDGMWNLVYSLEK